MKRFFPSGLLFALMSVFVLASCSRIDEHYTRNGQVFYGVTSNNEIVKYNAKNPEKVLQTLSVTGIESGDQLMAIDFRPATGQLYAMSRNSRLYIIDLQTGKEAATQLGALLLTASLSTAVNAVKDPPGLLM